MRTIDILTTQNVTINYELAEVRDRMFAAIVDLTFMVIALLVLSIFMEYFSSPQVFIYLVYLPFIFFYHLAFEVLLDGQTPGKKLLGIKVVKLNGAEPGLNDFIMRWAMRPVDVLFSLGAIGIMLISSSDKAQRLGDIVANTVVVKVNPSQRIKLGDILNIRTSENYTPVYPGARQFTEQEMLLLKEVLDKSRKYKNTAHYQALNEACEAMKQRLGLELVPPDKTEFLRTIIKDYVALSR